MIVINEKSLSMLLAGEKIGIIDSDSGKLIQVKIGQADNSQRSSSKEKSLNEKKPLLTRAGIIEQ